MFTLDLAEAEGTVRVKNGLFVIDAPDGVLFSAPPSEVDVIIASSPHLRLTLSALALASQQGVSVVICDEKYLPVGMLLPLEGNAVQAERFARQAAASRPTNKQLWRQIIRAKISMQARLLQHVLGDDLGLLDLAKSVRSGDPTNVEGQASRRYWAALFPTERFYRARRGPWPNPLLNYGYAILRAITARAVVAAGLHPSLGIHHHSRYDAFCLASDLMEPFRPLVDRRVLELTAECDVGEIKELTHRERKALLEINYQRFTDGKETRSLSDWILRSVRSVTGVYMGDRDRLDIPLLDLDPE
ncbi:MAG: type II CRISPR-associated endonuclease Cas1 [Acidothermus sp.]|nr:type II CRISPR-associated endonuclease Cas1 [Acidothermus sp.]